LESTFYIENTKKFNLLKYFLNNKNMSPKLENTMANEKYLLNKFIFIIYFAKKFNFYINIKYVHD